LLHAKPATACGQGSATLKQLLPKDGTQNVPLNAALIVSSQGETPEFLLYRVDASSDMTREFIPTHVTCRRAANEDRPSGALCFAHAQLEPQTEYEWTAQGLPNAELTLRRFTTSNAAAQASSLDNVSAELTEYRSYLNDCGNFSYALIEFNTTSLQQPVVAMVGVPVFPNHAELLEPSVTAAQMHLFDKEGCFAVELWDQLGNVAVLKELCFEEFSRPSRYSVDPSASGAASGGASGAATEAASGGAVDESSRAPLATVGGRGCSFAPQGASRGACLLPLLLGLIIARASILRRPQAPQHQLSRFKVR